MPRLRFPYIASRAELDDYRSRSCRGTGTTP